MAYFTQTDLELSLGGGAVLVQLIDKDGDGIADPAMVAAVLARATAEVASAIQTQLDLGALVAPYPDALVFKSADIGAYYAWLAGGEGQTVPEPVMAKYNDALRWLDQVAKRERTLGSTPKPTAGQFIEQVDRNPAANGTPTPTWQSMRGSFW